MKCACGKVHAFDALPPSRQAAEIERVVAIAEKGMREAIVRAVAGLDTGDAEIVAGTMLAAGLAALVCQIHGAAKLTARATLMSAHELSTAEGFEAAAGHPNYRELLRAEMARHVTNVMPIFARSVGATAVVTNTEAPS